MEYIFVFKDFKEKRDFYLVMFIISLNEKKKIYIILDIKFINFIIFFFEINL